LVFKRILKRIRPDDIVLLHDNRPPDKDLILAWLNEIENLPTGIETKGLWKKGDGLNFQKKIRAELSTRNTKDFNPQKHDFVEIPYTV